MLGEEADAAHSAAALESAKGVLRAEVAKQLGMRLVPSLTFVHDALPENARQLDEVLARARELDAELAARRSEGATYAGDADPYKKPHEPRRRRDRRRRRRRRRRRPVTAESGLVVVDKPGGMTSHDVVARVRRLAGTRKVGHAGTLDPMATGVLVLGVNRATRLLGHLMLTEKGYAATVRLGVATTTDDAEGETTAVVSAAGLDEATVRSALAEFVGDIEQVPTAVSAIKVDGKRAYQRVRDGEEVELEGPAGHRPRPDRPPGHARRGRRHLRAGRRPRPALLQRHLRPRRSPATWARGWASAGT